jgi:hypothetical protein
MQAIDLAEGWHGQPLAVEEQHRGGNQRQGMAVMIEGGGVELGGWRGHSQPGPLRDIFGQPWWILGERDSKPSDQQSITEEIRRRCTPRC